MKNLILGLFVVLLIIFCAVPVVSVADGAPPPSLQKGLVSGNNDFAVQLYRQLSASPGNLFFSPYSISSALGMVYAGARENTAKEIRNTMRFAFDQAQLNAAFKSLNRDMTIVTRRGGAKLNIANGLCLTGSNVSREFKNTLKESYDAEIFSGGLEEVNGWVKNKTEGKIPTILEKLDPNSVCVILNAIYFKGMWESGFAKDRTFDAPFEVVPGTKVTVPLMYQKNDFRFLGEQGFSALSLPYKGNGLSMVILLPEAADGLAGLEKQLTAASLASWLERLDKRPPRTIEVFLPRFKFETGYDLVPPFLKMGMNAAFGASADFGGMGWKKGDLWISQIRHKAFVEVNEEGTEAAAATAVEMVTKAAVPHDPVFRADHPFLFLIRENRTGAVLFVGRAVDPRAK